VARGPVQLSDLAKLAGLYPSKAHRYLVSLVRTGLAEQESAGRYTLGPAARRLGVEALRRGDEVSIATKHAIALRDETQHTTNLSTWGDAGPVIIRWDYGAYPLPITVRVGSTLPLVDSSVGRVCLAYMPSPLTTPVLREQQKHHQTSTPDKTELDELLQDVRDNGYSVTIGGVVPGLAAIAAPVFSTGIGVALVLGITLPINALTKKTEAPLVAELTEAATAITRDLGADERQQNPIQSADPA
jgi:DNA-binding IclR family transcriptional regulator